MVTNSNFFEGTNSVFNKNDENFNFSVSTPRHWNSEDCEESLKNLNKLKNLRSESDIELPVQEVEIRNTRLEIEKSCFNLAGFDHFKNEILAELKRVIYKGLEDLVIIMELTYDEIVDILDWKYFAGSTTGYTLPRGIHKITDFNLMLKSLLPKEVKVKITIVVLD